jgi:hypothetical protein
MLLLIIQCRIVDINMKSFLRIRNTNETSRSRCENCGKHVCRATCIYVVRVSRAAEANTAAEIAWARSATRTVAILAREHFPTSVA